MMAYSHWHSSKSYHLTLTGNNLSFESVIIIGNFAKNNINSLLSQVELILQERGIESTQLDSMHCLDNNFPLELAQPNNPTKTLGIVIGGDGTMLHAARSLACKAIPVVGINQGRLGFLTDIDADHLQPQLHAILAGEFQVEERLMLDVEQIHEGKASHCTMALNEVVLTRDRESTLIDVSIILDDEYAYTMRGDGVIVSTPTGSTGYSLSAGGPILQPSLSSFVLTPISPHTVSSRPIVLKENVQVLIKPDYQERTSTSMQLIIDGHYRYEMAAKTNVVVRRGNTKVKLIRPIKTNHFKVLRDKMGWFV